MFQYLHNARWVTLHVVVKDCKCVIVHLESITVEKDNASVVTWNLLGKLTDFKSATMLHFLL